MMERIRALADELRSTFRDADVEYTAFPSGSAGIDVRRAGRLFVLSYSPTREFGVDEVADNEAFQTGYRFTAPSFDTAAAHLKQLIQAAATGAPTAPSEPFLPSIASKAHS